MANKPVSLSALAIVFTTAATAPVVVNVTGIPAIAQTQNNTQPEFPLLKTVPKDTLVRIDGSSSMLKVNQALAENFKSQYPNTQVETTYNGVDAGLKAVLEGKADLAAIGRSLTEAEKAQGLAETAVARHKIAIFVGKDNPFNQSLNINQFAQIIRGEITDWSQVGGQAGKIRVIDRPDTSDTRRAFASYPVFKSTPFQTGSNAVKLQEDTTAAAIKAIGQDGIGYAIADQAIDNPDVKVLKMHQVLPTDQRYPFSQPLMYVYKGDRPNPAVQAFLGYATADQNQALVEKARLEAAKSIATASNPTNPSATAPTNPATTNGDSTGASEGSTINNDGVTSVEPADPEQVADAAVAGQADDNSSFPWWLLLIPLLGGILWWLLKNINGASPATPVAAAAAAGKERDSRIILTPRDARNGYAYWEIPKNIRDDLHRQGKRDMKLRLYDVTDIDLDLQKPHSVQEFNCQDRENDLHLQVPMDNREYVAEIGYPESDGNWYSVARSQPVRFPATLPEPTTETVNQDLNAQEQAEAASLWGNPQDVTSSPTNTTTNVNINTPEANDSSNLGGGIAGAGLAGAAAVGGASLFNLFDKNRSSQPDTTTKTGKIDRNSRPQAILVPRTADSAYAYWEIPERHQAELEAQGGQKLILRLYDTTGVDNFDTNTAEPFTRYDCTGQRDLHVRIPESERDYIAELGYETADGGWLPVAQTESVRVPAQIPTEAEPNGGDRDPSLPVEAAKVATKNLQANLSNAASNVTNKIGNGVGSIGRGATDLGESTGETTTGWMSGVKKSVGTVIAGGTAAVAGVGTATSGLWQRNANSSQQQTSDLQTQERPLRSKQQCQIILVPRNAQEAYAYWEISDEHKQAARKQGGRRFMLRIHDSTNLDIDYQTPHLTQEYACNEQDFDKHVTIPTRDRDYIAEVGYYTDDNRWIRIIRSFHVRV